jgi:hypothetical protein
MAALAAELRGEIRTLATELRGEMKTLAAELRGEMKALAAELRGEMAKLAADLRGELKAEIHATGSNIVRQLYLAVLGQMAVMLGFAYFFATNLR